MKKTNACPICSELVLSNIKIAIAALVNTNIYAIMGKTSSEVLLINSGTDTITLTEYGTTSTSSLGLLSEKIIMPPMGIAKLTASMMDNRWSDLWNSTIYVSGIKNAGGTKLLNSLINADGINGVTDANCNYGFTSGSMPLVMTAKTTATINEAITKGVINCIDIYNGDIIYGSETITNVYGVFFSVVHASGRSLFIGCTSNGKLLIGFRNIWYGNKITPLKAIYQGV